MGFSYTPALAVPHLKLTGNWRAFLSSPEPSAWNSFPPSLRACAVVCSDALPAPLPPCFAAISWPFTVVAVHGKLCCCAALVLLGRFHAEPRAGLYAHDLLNTNTLSQETAF